MVYEQMCSIHLVKRFSNWSPTYSAQRGLLSEEAQLGYSSLLELIKMALFIKFKTQVDFN